MLRYASVCSGIEAPTVAWHDLGMEPQWFSEIEAFPSAVLAHHYPNVPNLGDMTKIHDSEVFRGTAIDLLVGGTPCQAFSVAGLRKGLADPRGNLALVFLGLVDAARPRWVVWENVPGVLSSNGGRDFGAFLGALGELGYGFAYRVLDAQYFGVAQRRRRVFVVGYLGDWRRAAAVLFERDSLSGNPAPGRKAGEIAPACTSSSTRVGGRHGLSSVAALTATGVGTCGADDNQVQAGHLIASVDLQNMRLGGDLSGTLMTTSPSRGGGPALMVAHTLRGEGFDASEDGTGRGIPLVAHALTAHGQRQDGTVETLIAFDPTQITSAENRSNPQPGDPCHTLAKAAHAPAIAINARQDPDVSGSITHPLGAKDLGHGLAVPSGVRRLTPRECERLQGFPDDYTLIPWRTWQEAKRKGASYEAMLLSRGMRLREPAGDDCPDGPRYKALGNSMAVPVMRWIGERIAAIESPQPGGSQGA